jgi:peptidoglycan hydrolase-like protein with peptidoglycan-binding domain
MSEEFEEEPTTLGPGGILSGVFIAVMAMAIFYNAGFRQEAGRGTGRLPDLTEKFIEISSADKGRSTLAKPGNAKGFTAAVQKELKGLGVYEGPADGIDGQSTRKAIARYQRDNGLRATGAADQKLLDHIRFTRQVLAASEITESVSKSDPAVDDRVRMVQTGLSELGYRPGAIDGFLGTATREAIRQFERDRGLPETGELSQDLVDELREVSGVSRLH